MSESLGTVRSRAARLRSESRLRPRLSVVPPRVADARSGPFVSLVAAILVVGLVGLLLLNLSMQKGSFRLAELEAEASALQTRAQSLDLRVDRLSSSDRVSAEAIRLGMVPNPNPVFLDLSDGSVIGDPAAARARTVPLQESDPPPTESTPTDPAQPDSSTSQRQATGQTQTERESGGDR